MLKIKQVQKLNVYSKLTLFAVWVFDKKTSVYKVQSGKIVVPIQLISQTGKSRNKDKTKEIAIMYV